jgi:hypothetical protein
LQELADSLTARDVLNCGQQWLAAFTPFFHREGAQAGWLSASAVFRSDRTRITKQYRGKLQTVIEDMDLPNPMIRSHYGNCFVKQYVRDHVLLRTEPASNNVNDYGCKKAIENLPQVRENMSAVIDHYHNIQQDILETFLDRGQMRKLAQPTILPNGKRIPGLKLDHRRQLALMHALVRFCHIAAQNTFTTAEIYADTLSALELSPKEYGLGSLRYDLSKLRAKGLVDKLPHSRRYRLPREGYAICLVFLKLFERNYAPLTAGLLRPSPLTGSCSKKNAPNWTGSISAW